MILSLSISFIVFFSHFNLIFILMFFFKKYYIKKYTIYLRYIIKKLEIH